MAYVHEFIDEILSASPKIGHPGGVPVLLYLQAI